MFQRNRTYCGKLYLEMFNQFKYRHEQSSKNMESSVFAMRDKIYNVNTGLVGILIWHDNICFPVFRLQQHKNGFEIKKKIAYLSNINLLFRIQKHEALTREWCVCLK